MSEEKSSTTTDKSAKSVDNEAAIRLHDVASYIAQKRIDLNTDIPRIYNAIVLSANSDGSLTVYFPQDISDYEGKTMTVPNLTGYTPSVGGGVFICTTGGTNLTGAFAFAARGLKTDTITTIKTLVETFDSRITYCEEQITLLWEAINSMSST